MSTSSTSSTDTSTSSTLTMSGASFSALGIGSGLDLQSIVQALVTSYSQPQTELKNEVTTHQALVTQYQTLNTKFTAIQTAAESLNINYDWEAKTASSSSTSVNASATNAATAGSFTFQVNRLATAESAASYGSVASTDTVVGSGNLLLGEAGSLGLGNITPSSNLATGNHTVTVTQASNGAAVKGTTLADSITLNGTETLNATIDGVAKSFTLTAGTYNQKSLASMISSVSGGALNVSVNSDKSLEVASAHEGSAANMSITGGTGLSALGLSTTSTVNGTDGIVTVDGVANTVTSIKPDGSNNVTLNSTTGSINASFSGGLRLGTATVANISMGDGKLSTVVNAINNSGAKIAATAVQVGAGQYKLQLQANDTGQAGAISTNFSAFTSTLGNINVVTAAQNAQLQFGTGANSYTVDSSSNNVTGAIAGVTLNLTSADPNTPVTVTVGGDVKTLENNVKTLVNNVNDVLSYIKTNSTYDTNSKTAGPLLGNFEAQTLQSQIVSAMSTMFPGSDLGSLANIGITLSDDGTYAFDTTKFESAYSSDPNGVASLFVDGGTSGVETGHLGLAQTLSDLANQATDAINGSITTAINGENSTIADLNQQIDDWTTRIQQYQNQLIQQYSAADTAVANYKNTQTSLSGQISQLAANG
jgi:flagellar hook-associated protein 2